MCFDLIELIDLIVLGTPSDHRSALWQEMVENQVTPNQLVLGDLMNLDSSGPESCFTFELSPF